jgi:hypothetical protein
LPLPVDFTISLGFRSKTTNLDTSPKFLFTFLPDLPEKFLKIKDQAFISDRNGNRIPVEIEASVTKDEQPKPILVLTPKQQLAEDTWYKLDLDLDGSIKIKTVKLGTSISVEKHAVEFFTGSAPHLLAVEFASKDQEYLHLHFSEPIDRGSLQGNIQIKAGGKILPSCVVGNGPGGCMSKETWMSEWAAIRVEEKIQGPITITIGGQVVGSGREVADGVKFHDASIVSGDSLTYAISQWSQEDSQGTRWYSPIP